MIFQSFLLGNLVSLCMKIINSVVVVGLYYGFLTTFSIGPSYLFLLRAQVMEEGTEKKVSATTGFITGQLMMFISIYYAPLHLALGRPHTITVLALPYLLFHFFWNNHKHFFDYGSTTRNSMRNFSIQCLFLNNLIFQLFNHFILPSSMLARLVNIYMFRCNNKMLFVTSSFVGWLIGHILFMKWLGLVLVWIRQNHSIRSNVLIRSNKYLVSELINSKARILSILLFITCVYYLGRIPSPLFTKKLKETSKTEAGERVESEEERDVEIETASEMKGTKQEQEGSTEEDPSPYFFSEERADPNKIDETEEIQVNGKEKEFHFRFTETGYQNRPVSEESYLMNINENQDNSRLKIFDQKTENKELIKIFFDKPLVTILFDSKRWNRPLRYIKNKRFDKAVRNEMSQYFFDICQSDGKERISFTYPPSLSIFLEMIKKRISPPTIKKFSFNELYNPWVYTNKQKNKSLNNEFLNRIKTLDKENIYLNILEIRTRLCNEHSTKEYLSKRYDPFLNGSHRKTIYKSPSPSTLKKTLIENFLDPFGINRIHSILLPDTDYQEFEQKRNRFEKKSLSTEIVHFLTFISKFVKESGSRNLNPSSLYFFSEGTMDSQKETKYFNYLLNLNKIVNDANGQKINRKSIRIKEINKKVPRWSYKLITDLEQQSRKYKEDIPIGHQIRSRRGKRIVILTATKDTPNTTNSKLSDIKTDVTLMRYSQQSDFRRGIIKGSMRAQRRKVVIFELFQANVKSPLFLGRLQKSPPFSFNISGWIKLIFKNGLDKRKAFKLVEYRKEQTKREEKQENNKRKEKARIKVSEDWNRFPFAQGIRGCVLLTQSIFRKYILLPSLIIAKNIGRIFLLQRPEWSEDFHEWNKEIYIKCTYNGIPLSETEFPKNWLTEGIQIKILFPFCLKPSQKSKLRLKKKKEKGDFCFLTVWGMETELPFCLPRKKPSFFKPILKEFEKTIGKFKKKYFRVRTVFKFKTKLLRKVSKETKKWVIKSVFFRKRIIKELSKVNPILLFRLREIGVDKSSEIKEEKDSIINNQLIHESFSQIQITSPSWTNSSLTEKKMKDLTDRTSTILNQIERITKEKKKVTPRLNNISPTSYNAKKLEKQQMFKMFKRRNARLICKLSPFVKFFIEKIYTDIFLYIINIPRINTELFLKLTKKIMDKFIYNNERKQEIINKKKKTPIPSISSIIKALDTISNIKANSHIFYDLSHVPQPDVFSKLGKIQVSNSLRFVVQYKGIPFFLKAKIKDSFETQGILDSKSADNKLPSYEMNPKENFSKRHSYEKNPLMNSKKQKQFEVYSLSNQKENFLKYYRSALLSYKFIHYEKKTECFFYGSPFQGNTNQEIYYNTPKKNFFDMLRNIPIKNDLGKIHMEKPADRKYFDWQIFKFDLIQKVDIEAWIIIDTNRNQNTQIRTKNSQIISKKDFFYLKIPEINLPNSHKGFCDWMGMNEKMLKHPISNLELWFFPEFLLLYKTYKMKPWFIPSKLLLLNLNRSENKKHRNQEEKEPTSRGEGRSVLSLQKDIEENYARSNMKKGKNKKQYTKAELRLFLKRYLLFQLRWDETLNERMINNINVYCLLRKLIDSKKITISSIQKKQMSLDIMMINKNLTLSEFLKKGVFILEPIRLSEQKDGQFIMYQTVGISLVHKNKHQKYQEQGHASTNNLDETISLHQRITGNRNQNCFDLLVPENILSFRRRRKLRILICFNSKKRNYIDQNPVFWNVKNNSQVAHDNNHLDRDKNQLMKLKLFLWPNYRLEDLACMNRYWFDTNNGSHFGMLRIQMYPRLKIFG
uniref:Protein TIC 214 n=1 Tax=Eriophyton wallichii TaxID=694358 RepID=A0A7S6PWN0_9LAMI|nr:hypothetical protein RF1 [Eriophyton wallichii]QOU11428.1 hypothetical protein RF1 [Eriophyton wallichii]